MIKKILLCFGLHKIGFEKKNPIFFWETSFMSQVRRWNNHITHGRRPSEVYLFILRERESKQGRVRERGRQRESQAGFKPRLRGSNPPTMRSWPEPKPRVGRSTTEPPRYPSYQVHLEQIVNLAVQSGVLDVHLSPLLPEPPLIYYKGSNEIIIFKGKNLQQRKERAHW